MKKNNNKWTRRCMYVENVEKTKETDRKKNKPLRSDNDKPFFGQLRPSTAVASSAVLSVCVFYAFS